MRQGRMPRALCLLCTPRCRTGLESAEYERRKEEVADAFVARLERYFPGLKEGTVFRYGGLAVQVCACAGGCWEQMGCRWGGHKMKSWRWPQGELARRGPSSSVANSAAGHAVGLMLTAAWVCCQLGVHGSLAPCRRRASHGAHPAAPHSWRREVGTPRTHRRFLNRSDGTYGPIPSRRPLGMLGMPFNRTAVPGLYCVGDSTFPGQGVNAVVFSGFGCAHRWGRGVCVVYVRSLGFNGGGARVVCVRKVWWWWWWDGRPGAGEG